MNVLFVCSGNVSRSFLAEALLRHEMDRLGRTDVSVSSAGLYAFPGSPADPKMVQYLESLDIMASPHEARQVSPEDVDRADLIVVMEKRTRPGNRQAVARHRGQSGAARQVPCRHPRGR